MKFKEQNITQAGAVLLLSAIIVKLIGALFKIPLSADFALGDLGFGYFSSAYDMYTPIYTLALSGFPVAIARMVADFTAKSDTNGVRKVFAVSYKTLLISGVLVSIAVTVIALPLIMTDFRDGNFGYSLLAVAPSVICCGVSSVYRGYFEGLKNMTLTAVSNIIEALGKLCLGLSGAVITMRLTGNAALAAAATMLGITIGMWLSVIYLRITFKKNNNINPSVTLKESIREPELLRELMRFLIPIAVASLVVGLTAFIDSLTLKAQLKAVLESNPENSKILLKGTLYSNIEAEKIPTLLYGIKSKTHTLFNLVPTLALALGMGAIPLVTENYVMGQNKGLRENVNTVLKISSILVLPVSVGFMSMGEGIMTLLYGEKSAELGGKLLFVYGIAALFAGLSVPTTSLLQALNKQRIALYNIIVGLAVKLLLNLILTPIAVLNVSGTAIGTAVCFIIIFILNLIFLIRECGFLPDIKSCFLKPMLAALGCGLTAFICEMVFEFKYSQIISISSGGIIYILILILLKTVSKKELKNIVK